MLRALEANPEVESGPEPDDRAGHVEDGRRARPDSATAVASETMTTARATPLVIGHRGASADAPENTIAAFELALDQGADGIALDVHLTRRRPAGRHPRFHPGAHHRRRGSCWRPHVREIKRLDAGGWRGRRFRGQRVQTLQEVLERFRDRTRFWIELKGGSALYPGIEERVVSMVEIYEVVDRALMQSFDHAASPGCGRSTGRSRLGALVAQVIARALPARAGARSARSVPAPRS